MRFINQLVLTIALFAVATISYATEDEEAHKMALLKNAKKVRSFNNVIVNTAIEAQDFSMDGPVIDPVYYDSVKGLHQKIEALEQRIRETNNYIDQINAQALTELPAGISKKIGNLEYMIMIDQVRAGPDRAEVDVYMSFVPPENNKRLNFMGRRIQLDKDGGITGNARLELIGDYLLNESSKMQIKLLGGKFGGPQFHSPTFALFDCNGYREMSITAEATFSRSLVVPETTNGTQHPSDSLKASFGLSITDWNNKMVSINLPPFQFTKLEGVGFYVQNAVLDLSDHQNAPSTIFPQGYLNNFYGDVDPSVWRGVFLSEVQVRLPKELKDTKTDERIGFGGKNLLIDRFGFSGVLSAFNVLSMDHGQIGNWSFSIDELQIALQAGSIKQSGFNGRIEVPVITDSPEGITNPPDSTEKDQTNGLIYNALFKEHGNYIFSVQLKDEVPFNVFSASAKLYQDSYIKVEKKDGVFLPEAFLNGELSIDAPLKESENETTAERIKVGGIQFQGLCIKSKAPHFTVQSFSLGKEGKPSESMKFPISINEVYGAIQGDQFTLGLGVTLNLTNSEDGGGFGASGRFAIQGEKVVDGIDSERYKFRRLLIDEFSVDVSNGPISIKGALQIFKEDPVYGNGISGNVKADFGEKLSIEAKAIFGKRATYRYWYADANASGINIPLVPGLLDINGFGGGAYYHMSIDQNGSQSPIGISSTGIVYSPDSTLGLGLKATVLLSSASENVFYGNATYEMAFNSGGGLRYISFTGNAYFLSTNTNGKSVDLGALAKKMAGESAKSRTKANPEGNLDSSNENDPSTSLIFGDPSKSDAAISAHLHMLMDFNNKSFHAQALAYVNIEDIITGVGPNNRAGWMVMHFGRDDWYIYVGYPDYERRIGLQFIGWAQATAYFVTGTKIPGFPPPPHQVQSIFSHTDLAIGKSLLEAKPGKGIGFGANFTFDTGELSFLIFYARFAIGLGFDAMLTNYGSAQCTGMNGQIGINGWYSQAQVYAHITGKVGIQLTIMKKKRRIDICDIQIAAILQAQLPNPTWMRGMVGGRFNVLGGFVKGDFSFEFELGEKCELQNEGSALEGLEVIADITPNGGSLDVSVFNTPQVVFNYEVGRAFQMLDNNDQLKKFRIILDHFNVQHLNQNLEGEAIWNDDNTVLAFNPEQVLPGLSDIKVFVKVSFEEWQDGEWIKVQIDGEPLSESKTISFKTDEAPDYIEPSNVTYSYPLVNQYLLYTMESNEGFIRMNVGQDYLFNPGDKWIQKARFTTESGYVSSSDFTYSNKQVNFQLPSDIPMNSVVTVQLVDIPAVSSEVIDSNVDTINNQLVVDEFELNASVRTKVTEGTIENLEEKVIYENQFRTSQYKTLAEKFDSQKNAYVARYPITAYAHNLKWQLLPATELFSTYELGTTGTPPMIHFEADLEGNNWFEDHLNPMLYENYPINSAIKITRRPLYKYSPVPSNQIDFVQYNEYNSDLNETPQEANAILYYNIAVTAYYDYSELRSKAATYLYNGGYSNYQIENLLTENFPVLKKGEYKFKVGYQIPGTSQIKYSHTHSFFNPIEF